MNFQFQYQQSKDDGIHNNLFIYVIHMVYRMRMTNADLYFQKIIKHNYIFLITIYKI